MRIPSDQMLREGRYGLAEANHARRRLAVADVGLVAGHDHLCRTIGAEDGSERAHLCRIAERRTRTVSLHTANIGHCHARKRRSILEHDLLSACIRRGKTRALAVVTSRNARQKGLFRLARLRRDELGGDTLRTAHAIRTRVKRLATSVSRDDSNQAHGEGRVRQQLEADAKRDTLTALILTHRLSGVL